MIFIALTFIAAFLIEGLGTYVSVIGLSTLFGANPIIIALAIALDMGKLVVVTLLYTYWKKLGKLMRAYALIASVITMTITSAGAAGYLSGEFQKAILGTQEIGLKVDVLKKQIAKYEERKKQIDDQIAAIPEKYTANQRIRLMNQFKAEQQDLQAKIAAIDKDLPALQINQIGVEAKAGPILYVAKAFDIPVEQAVKWVILMIIFVFDPLAVFLIIAGNFLLHQRKLHKDTNVADADLFEEAATPVKVPAAETAAAMEEAREMQKQVEHVYVPVAEAPPAPMYELLEPSPAPDLAEGTEVRVANPVDSDVLPKYLAQAHPPEEPKEREEITLSTLGVVKPDPSTITDVTQINADDEVGRGTGVYKTGHNRK